jgi:hypothetical protein
MGRLMFQLVYLLQWQKQASAGDSGSSTIMS